MCEVCQDQAEVRKDQDVMRLNIAMNVSIGVEIQQRLEQLNGHFPKPGDVEGAFRQILLCAAHTNLWQTIRREEHAARLHEIWMVAEETKEFQFDKQARCIQFQRLFQKDLDGHAIA